MPTQSTPQSHVNMVSMSMNNEENNYRRDAHWSGESSPDM